MASHSKGGASRRTPRAMLQRLFESAKNEKIKLRALELIMIIDGIIPAESVASQTRQTKRQEPSELSDLVGLQLTEKSTGNADPKGG